MKNNNSNKPLTIVKILAAGENPTQEDIERWRKLFANYEANEDIIKDACANNEIAIETNDQKLNDPKFENAITLVKIGNDDHRPTLENLKQWRELFIQAKDDPNYFIFHSQYVSVELVPIGNFNTIVVE